MLEDGHSYVAFNKDCICRKMEKKAGTIHDKISEVRILQQAKLELEQQLKGKQFNREREREGGTLYLI